METEEEREDISLAICGHAWHGKSTLLGKLVAECGMASHRDIEEARRLASEGRDHSLVFAQLVFRSKDVHQEYSEAARGVTVLPSIVRFEFPAHRVTVIDTPGQETYANNRFFGMFQADSALLVIDADDGIKPITLQVMRILRGYEIPVHACVLAKMDRLRYEEAPYRERVAEIKDRLSEYGVKHEQAVFIPTSAYAPGRDLFEPGEGITKFQHIKWYDGPTLRDFMKDLSFKRIRSAPTPVRLLIHGSEVYDHVPGIGKAATALVETGVVRPDMTLVFEPLSAERNEQVTGKVRSVQLTRGHFATPGVPIDEGVPRQLVGVAMRSVSVKDSLRELFKGRGVVAGTPEAPPRVATRFELELTVFDPDTILRTNEHWTMHVHVDRAAIQVDRIVAKRAQESDEWTPARADDAIFPGEWGKVEASTVTRPVAIEEADVLPPLAKVVLRKDMKAVAYGRCTKILGMERPPEARA